MEDGHLSIGMLRGRLRRIKRVGSGIFVIEDFLEHSYARKILKSLEDQDSHSWSLLARSQGRVKELVVSPRNRTAIRATAEAVARELNAGGFAFRFYRTRRQKTHRRCAACGAMRWLTGGPVRREVGRIFGRRLTAAGPIACTRFGRGDFLTAHSDTLNGSVAFVLSLTDGWRPEFGGLLHFLSANRKSVRHVIVPKFNQFVVFDTSNERRAQHFVSQIVAVSAKRFAISGWYR
jgi:SM-20-related protein